jgi:hypothetical protein
MGIPRFVGLARGRFGLRHSDTGGEKISDEPAILNGQRAFCADLLLDGLVEPFRPNVDTLLRPSWGLRRSRVHNTLPYHPY